MPRKGTAVADRSTRPLSEVARHVVVPDGIVDTLWFDVEERCAEFGDEFDAWQDGLGQVVLGLREDGTFAATIGGVTISIPRQVAKTFIVMRIVVALCTLFDNLTVIWTAHRGRTCNFTFKKMKSFALSPEVRKYLKPGINQGTAIRDANGEQEIPFKNGSQILFGAREQGFGRGFDEVDIAVFDEAQILTERALEDVVPGTNQSRLPHGALIFYMGTPPRPVDPGEVFTSRRDEAIELKGDAEDFSAPAVVGDAIYVECSADEDADADDEEQWAKANPSYPHRTPRMSMLRLRKQLRQLDSWRREGLGIWDAKESEAGKAIPFTAWDALLDPLSVPDESTVRIALATPPEGWRTSIGLAGLRADGRHHVESVASQPGMDWVPERCQRIAERLERVRFVVQAGHPLVAELEAAGLDVDEITAREQAAATTAFIAGTRPLTVDEVTDETIEALPEGHPLRDVEVSELSDRPPLIVHTGRDVMIRNSLKRAKTASAGRNAITWVPVKATDDISPLHAVTWAYGRLGGDDDYGDPLDALGF